MAKNFIQPGNTLDHIVAGSPSVSGAVLVVNEQVGVFASSEAVGVTVGLHVRGVFDLPKAGAETPGFGERLFWDGAALTLTAATNVFAGLCARPATAGEGTVWCNLGAGAIAGGV